jgi:hypothetical protein
MPAATRKAADAAPAVEAEKPEPAPAEAEAAGSAAPVAEETAAEAEQDEPRAPAKVTFNGQAQSSVTGVGLCDPGETYTVPAAVADELCGAGATLFTRVETD